MASQQHPSISITLTLAQVDEVVRAAAQARTPTIPALVADSREDGAAEEATANGVPPQVAVARAVASSADARLSRSLMRGLSLLRCFDPDGRARGIVEVANELQISPSTAHRYAVTLVELGLLERCPTTRKYRLAAP